MPVAVLVLQIESRRRLSFRGAVCGHNRWQQAKEKQDRQD
jgi:hypothetical protein